MTLLRVLALAVLSFLFAGQAVAQSNEEIIKRLEAVETSNAALMKENANLRVRVQRLEGAKAAQSPNHKLTADNGLPVVTPAKEPVSTERPFEWTNFHVGIQSGFAAGNEVQQSFPAAAGGFSGWLFGSNAGFDYQFDPHWVAGIEVDYSMSDVEQTHYFFGGDNNLKIQDLGSARGRLGYVWDYYMAYLTGGYAWGDLRDFEFHTFPQLVPSAAATTTVGLHGYAVGAGMQWAATDNLVLKAEYLYMDFGSPTTILQFPAPVGASGGTSRMWLHTVRAGADWLFH